MSLCLGKACSAGAMMMHEALSMWQAHTHARTRVSCTQCGWAVLAVLLDFCKAVKYGAVQCVYRSKAGRREEQAKPIAPRPRT